MISKMLLFLHTRSAMTGNRLVYLKLHNSFLCFTLFIIQWWKNFCTSVLDTMGHSVAGCPSMLRQVSLCSFFWPLIKNDYVWFLISLLAGDDKRALMPEWTYLWSYLEHTFGSMLLPGHKALINTSFLVSEIKAKQNINSIKLSLN